MLLNDSRQIFFSVIWWRPVRETDNPSDNKTIDNDTNTDTDIDIQNESKSKLDTKTKNDTKNSTYTKKWILNQNWN